MAFVYEDERDAVSDCKTGILLRRIAPDTGFWDINDAELIQIDAPGRVVQLSVRKAIEDSLFELEDEDLVERVLDTPRYVVSPGPSPTRFVKFPAGEDVQTSFDWLTSQWEYLDEGIRLLYSRSAGELPVVTNWK